jgi:hypothetical protein
MDFRLPQFLFKRKGRKEGAEIAEDFYRLPITGFQPITEYIAFVSFVPFLCSLCGERISTLNSR